MSLATCSRSIGRRDLVAASIREPAPVPAREDKLECGLDVGPEVEPPGKPLGDLAHRREGVASPRAGVRDRILDELLTHLGRAARSDIGPIKREHLRGIRRVDQEEGGPVCNVVAVELSSFVPVRRASRSVEQSDVVRGGEILGRRSGKLAETDGEDGRAQRMLERLTGAEVGRKRQRPDHLCRTDGRLLGERPRRLRSAVRSPTRTPPYFRSVDS